MWGRSSGIPGGPGVLPGSGTRVIKAGMGTAGGEGLADPLKVGDGGEVHVGGWSPEAGTLSGGCRLPYPRLQGGWALPQVHPQPLDHSQPRLPHLMEE